jgi:exopolysaccharide biosynthesis polyprenyl glycosylphosphotransferase
VFLVCCGSSLVFLFRFGVRGLRLEALVANTLEPSVVHVYLGFLLLYCSLIVLACLGHGLYRTPREVSAFVETERVAKAVFIATALLAVFIFTSGNKEVSRLVVSMAGAVNVVTLSGWRYAKRRLVLRRAERGIGQSRVLIVGAGRTGRALASWLADNRHLGYDVCGFLDEHVNGEKRVLGTIGELRRVVLAQFADEIFVTLPSDGEMIKRLVLEARKLRVNLHVIPEMYDGLAWRAPLHAIGGFPLLELYGEPIPAAGLALKRAIDIAASLFGLVLVSPLLLVAAIWIRLDSRGPAFYRAQRVGKKGKRFVCYKLRTMIESADAQKDQLRSSNERQGPTFKIEEDPRVTRSGRWLRKYSVDELPQLWNVLRGDMSLVGPRPHPLDDVERYTLEHLRRLDVKPGITGLWQVTARRDPSFDTNMALDLEYIENWSLRMDLRLLLRTIPSVLRAEGH